MGTESCASPAATMGPFTRFRPTAARCNGWKEWAPRRGWLSISRAAFTWAIAAERFSRSARTVRFLFLLRWSLRWRLIIWRLARMGIFTLLGRRLRVSTGFTGLLLRAK